MPEKEYCTQKANVCVSGKTRYRKWFEKRITTAKRKWNASNDEKLQKAAKTALRSAKGPQTAEKAESEKRGLFHSPIFHITCIIRNIDNQKNRSPLSSTFEFGDPFVSASSGTGSFCRYISFCSIQGKSGQLFRLRLCAKVFTDRLIINACRFFTAFFAAEPCCIGFICYKALFCQYSRTVHIF